MAGGRTVPDPLQALAELGIDLAEVTEELERDGIVKFADSYDALLALLEGIDLVVKRQRKRYKKVA